MPDLIDAATWLALFHHRANTDTAHLSQSLVTPYHAQEGTEYTALCGEWVLDQAELSTRRARVGLPSPVITELRRCEICARIEHAARPDTEPRSPESFIE